MPESKERAQKRADDALFEIFRKKSGIFEGVPALNENIKVPDIYLPAIGGSSSANTITVTAGENLSGHRVVYVDNGSAFLFDPTNSSHWFKQLGFTTAAGTTGNPILLVIEGLIDWTAAPLTANKTYYSTPTGISFTAPTSGLLQKVGISTSSTKLVVDFDLSIILV